MHLSEGLTELAEKTKEQKTETMTLVLKTIDQEECETGRE